MMHRSATDVDLPKTRYYCAELFRPQPKPGWSSDLTVERELRAGSEANGDVRPTDGAEAAGEGVSEPRSNQLVADFGWARSQMFQAVVAHRRIPRCAPRAVSQSLPKVIRNNNRKAVLVGIRLVQPS